MEFDCDEVAKIVAETMNNYLMGERLIKCHMIPPEKVHEKLFVGSQRDFKKPSHPAVARYNKKHTEEQLTKMKDKLLRKEGKLRKRLAAHGIDYDFPGFAAQLPQKKKSTDESTCSDDTTPVCTPSVLERRKSMPVDDDADDEIIVKMPAAVEVEDESEEEEEEEDSNKEEEDEANSDEPTEEDAAAE